ncbi:MAG: DNA-binding protein [Chitinophagia bacterium]|nr:DNA-binding protein [Chitinophagia bacterium]
MVIIVLGLVPLKIATVEMRKTTTAEPAAIQNKPVFIRVSDVTRIYGLKRGFLYNMVKAGRLKSTTLRSRCGIKGIVLFRPEDIEGLIAMLSRGVKS